MRWAPPALRKGCPTQWGFVCFVDDLANRRCSMRLSRAILRTQNAEKSRSVPCCVQTPGLPVLELPQYGIHDGMINFPAKHEFIASNLTAKRDLFCSAIMIELIIYTHEIQRLPNSLQDRLTTTIISHDHFCTVRGDLHRIRFYASQFRKISFNCRHKRTLRIFYRISIYNLDFKSVSMHYFLRRHISEMR